MILSFPNAAAFQLAATADLLPADIPLAPARVAFPADGTVAVEFAGKVNRKALALLAKQGVNELKQLPGEGEAVSCWLQAVPATPDAAPPKLAANAPVLFDVPTAHLPKLVGEMLRLGNDRQSYHFLTGPGDDRALLRVVAPPYYTLLRALDVDSSEFPVAAFVEAAPRVWVEFGCTHPAANMLKVAEGQQLLIRRPRQWTFLPDEPFADVYDLLRFHVPAQPTAWVDATPTGTIPVPLRLTAGTTTDPAELWVVRGAGIDAVDALVRESDDRLLQQLRFAVATHPTAGPAVLIRVKPGKETPPAVQIPDAVAYRHYWKLPNLFLPVASRLHPTVRRETVRQLLAPDPDRVVWLEAGYGGTFTPESVPDIAFRPLSDWVEYVIELAAEPLAAWVESTRFDFESFVCVDPKDPKPKPPADKAKSPSQTDADLVAADPTFAPAAFEKESPFTLDVPAAAPRPASELKLRRDALEAEFLAADGPLDGPARTRLWPELAAVNAALGDGAKDEAAVCFLNALWADPRPVWLRAWHAAETGEAGPSADGVEKLLAIAAPTPAELRAFAAAVLAANDAAWLKAKLPAVRAFAEKHDRGLPVRAAWLLAAKLAHLSGADVLGLARSRDRLLLRLLEDGLTAERDLPGFLRYAGAGDADRTRAVRDEAGRLHAAAKQWAAASLKPVGSGYNESDTVKTQAYIDLLFAFAFAGLGEMSAADAAVFAAKKTLDVPPPRPPGEKESVVPYASYLAGRVLFEGLSYRVRQAAQGKPHGGMLPPEITAEIDAIKAKADAAPKNVTTPWGMALYVVARMQTESRVLEPASKFDPYGHLGATNELTRLIVELSRLREPAEVERKARQALKYEGKGKAAGQEKLDVLRQILPAAARVGEAFSVELLDRIPGVLKGVPPGGPDTPADVVQHQGQLFERGLFLAAHYDRTDRVRQLVDLFFEFLKGKPDAVRFELVAAVAGRSLRSFRKLGLRDEIDKLLRRLQTEILGGKDFAALRTLYATKPDVWADALNTLLAVAAGRLCFGLTEQAVPILDAVRDELAGGGGKMPVGKFVKLAGGYAAALGQGPADVGLPRLFELFEKLPPARVTNTHSTAPYYARFHLAIVEEVVLALVSDEFAAGAGHRKWLDEDEAIVRRKVHADVKALVRQL